MAEAVSELLSEVRLLARMPSLANMRGHWAKKAKIVAQHVNLGGWVVAKAFGTQHSRARARGVVEGIGEVGAVLVVKMTRIAPRPLDTDNLAGCFKGIRDGIAAALGVDDSVRVTHVRWVVTQERGAPKEHALRVRFFVEAP